LSARAYRHLVRRSTLVVFPWDRQRRLAIIGKSAVATGVPAALIIAYTRLRHPALAFAAVACIMAEAAIGVHWYRIAFAPEGGELPGQTMSYTCSN
jgi:hypothetical protein